MNMEKYKNKSKHFTPLEKKLFLDILKRYKHVIEVKKNDFSTLKDKDVAWTEVTKEFNTSQLISQERTVQQLKKLWTNLKQNQRDALTKEKQALMATGGGPSIPAVEVDPDVSAIAPNLMTTAPTIYSSNFDNEEIEERERQMISYDENVTNDEFQHTEIIFSEGEIVKSSESNDDDIHNSDGDISNKENSISDISREKNEKNSPLLLQNLTTPITKSFTATESRRLRQDEEKSSSKKRIKHSVILANDYENEVTLKKERIQKILEQEMEISTIKIEHEKKISSLKEQHLIKIHEQELRASIAAAETAELQKQLQMKKNENYFKS